MRTKPWRGRLLAALAAAAALVFISMQPNFASDAQRAYMDKTARCLSLLMEDPVAQARKCGGGTAPTAVPQSLSTPVNGAPGPAAPAIDPCASGAPSGGAGNAANAGSPCLNQSGYLAPLLSDFFTQLALLVWPSENKVDIGTDG